MTHEETTALVRRANASGSKKQRARELRSLGWSYRRIAEELDVSFPATIFAWCDPRRDLRGVCECGCGEETTVDPATFVPRRFRPGHHHRMAYGEDYVVDGETGCWNWQHFTDGLGYGRVNRDGRSTGAHRWYYERLVGPVPAGLVLDHLCRNPSCVNPAHLEPVTQRVNMERGAQAQATHCKRGHEFSEENTYRSPSGNRTCRACRRRRLSRTAA